MTPIKRWPDTAKHARDMSAENCQYTIRLLRPLLDHKDPVVLARVGKSIDTLQTTLRLLEGVGAGTRPDYETGVGDDFIGQ